LSGSSKTKTKVAAEPKSDKSLIAQRFNSARCIFTTRAGCNANHYTLDCDTCTRFSVGALPAAMQFKRIGLFFCG
jgi:hypothetical protein